MASLNGYINQRVLLILQDGRCIVGTLAGFDNRSDIVLSNCIERTYSPDEPVEEVSLGLYLVKGDMILLVGELDTELEASLDLSQQRAEPLQPIRYGPD
ncbi:Sm-like ribonucleo protein [Dacryopinax primogenitus]|uniref:LSM2-LSM8 complex subunit LSM8 n=1 Tax=Dacryopinax primogenitus (strain DJM 731) TaxID=1858805 RepID=M5GD99_DACPD|nr:Sm-like ribonucleoprotein [Dacryopinax primogenitus]EJU02188.1 Sm-like ribonucleo protein [Dacryopinax primogenitus]